MGPASKDTLKAPFWGALTATAGGFSGEISTDGYSMIPASQDIAASFTPVVCRSYTWEDILIMGAARPPEPTERFTLGGVRILEMRMDTLKLCMDSITQSSFRYDVHFPWPSYINLDFEDPSLDATGYFSWAKGPITSRTAITPNATSFNEQGNFSKGTKLLPNPDERILWAWRLPVSFAERAVAITFVGSGRRAQVAAPYDTSHHNALGQIVASELWVVPLYSRNSATQRGIRFGATMDSLGGFVLRSWDLSPFFSKSYAPPGSERRGGFDCTLGDTPGFGITLADPFSDPTHRASDVSWRGSLRFPFFGWLSPDSAFILKNLLPSLPGTLAMIAQRPRASTCLPDGREVSGVDISTGLRVRAPGIRFRYDDFRFDGPADSVVEISSAGQKSQKPPFFLSISSFDNAHVTLGTASPEDIIVKAYAQVYEDCGVVKEVQAMMKNAIKSSSIKDLVCYDQLAWHDRNVEGLCCGDYLMGTYVVTTRSSAGAPERILVSIDQVCYYPSTTPPTMLVSNSPISLLNDDLEPNESDPTVINIPGAQLRYDQGVVQGAFGATNAEVANNLPYEGEFQFYLDLNRAYYYVQIAGSFTYVARFSGEIFIIHAPFAQLLSPSVFPGVSDIVDDLYLRANFPDRQTFLSTTHLDRVPDGCAIVNGMFSAGTASLSFDVGLAGAEVRAGAGFWGFQFKTTGGPLYSFGTFANGKVSAHIGASLAEISASGSLGLTTRYEIQKDITGFRSLLTSSEISASGWFKIEGCVSAGFGHCSLGFGCDDCVSLSTKEGLTFSGPSLTGGCGWGGCP